MKNLKLSTLKNVTCDSDECNIKKNVIVNKKDIVVSKREKITKYSAKNTQELFEEYLNKMNNKLKNI
jgi:hypothetical protein